MIITSQQLTDVYVSIIETSGHIDPLGYISRAYLLSGGDINYYDEEGRIGFYPVKPQDAMDIVGSNDVSTLEGNIISTIGMEMVLIDSMGYDDAIKFMTYGKSLKDINKVKDLIDGIIHPRLATVKDIIDMLKPYLSKTQKVSDKEKKFFKELMG